MHRSYYTFDRWCIFVAIHCLDDMADSQPNADDWSDNANGNFCLFADCADIGEPLDLPDDLLRLLDSDAYCLVGRLDIELDCCRNFQHRAVVGRLVSMVYSR